MSRHEQGLLSNLLMYLRPHTLHWYILKEFLYSFVLALTVCTCVMLLAFLVVRASEFEEFGVTYGQVAQLSPLFLPFCLGQAIAPATMIAAILVYGRLAAENELLAAQSVGASIGHLSTPVVFCGLVLTAITFWCNDVGVQWGFTTLREQVMNLSNPDLIRRLQEPGKTIYFELSRGNSLYINMLPIEQDPVTGREKRPIHIAQFSRGNLDSSFYAGDHESRPLPPEETQKDSFLGMSLALREMQSLGGERKLYGEEIIGRLGIPFDDNKLSLGRSRGTVGWMQNLADAQEIVRTTPNRRAFVLERAADVGAAALAGSKFDPVTPLYTSTALVELKLGSNHAANVARKIQQEMVEFHRKVALSAICFSMVILGIGLGLLVRKSQRLVGFVLGILAYFLLYYPLMVISKEMAIKGVLPAWALWAPNLFLLIAGSVMIWGYQSGRLNTGLPQWLVLPAKWITARLSSLFGGILRPIREIRFSRLLPLRKKTDRHVAGAFLGILLAVMCSIGGLYITLDLFENGSDVISGLEKFDREMPGVPKRSSFTEALIDVLLYYFIRALAMSFNLLPIMILIAAVFAITSMVRNNEHLIFKASGLPLQRAFRVILYSTLLISLTVFYMREKVMPDLTMHMDRLKPAVFRVPPKSRSIAGQTRDEDGKLVIYEIGGYNRNTRAIENLRLSFIGERKDGIIPLIYADRAQWDQDLAVWKLSVIDPHSRRPKPGSTEPVTYLPFGYKTSLIAGHGADDSMVSKGPVPIPGATNIETWSGKMTPAFLDSERRGATVMQMAELWNLQEYPQFGAEFYRRLMDGLTSLILLTICIPFLVRQEVRSSLSGIAYCIACAVLFVVLSFGVTEAASENRVAIWMPVLPHLLFGGLGLYRYYCKMET